MGRIPFNWPGSWRGPTPQWLLVAMYEQDQCLPLPAMYGKNLTFRTGGVDAVHGERLMGLLAAES